MIGYGKMTHLGRLRKYQKSMEKLAATNTLAYFVPYSVTQKKSTITLTPGDTESIISCWSKLIISYGQII